MRKGFSFRLVAVSFLAFVLCILFFTAPPINAQQSIEGEQSRLIENLQLHLQTINAAATSLQAESANWKALSAENEQRVAALLSELAGLRQELESWQSASEDSQRQVVELRVSLEQSETKLMRLSATWKLSADSWKAAADAQRVSTRRWKWRSVFIGLAAAAVGGLVGYLIGK